MTEPLVRTQRLHLYPMSPEAIDALVAGDAARLRSITGVQFPTPVAPPPYMAESLPVVLNRLRAHAEESAWWNWLVVRQDTAEVVGSVAFGGMPDAQGAVLIGYAMYPDRVGSGFATEAVRAMVEWAFAQPGVEVVRALAPVWNTPAVHVAEKIGMRPVSSDEDDEIGEVLVYEVTKKK
jgi:ribosomal-protein-alanine N-acetyltransferase